MTTNLSPFCRPSARHTYLALDAAAFCKAYWLAEWAQLEEVSAGMVGGAAAGWAGVSMLRWAGLR